jgi:acetolactate synthase-1/2/3 large subunit
VLPREPLSATLTDPPAIMPRPVPTAAWPDPAAIEQLAGWLASAERPLVITAGPGTDTSAVAALAKVADRAAIPVVAHNPRSVPLPASHPMHAGYDSGPHVGDADLIIVIESDAPWYPRVEQPAPGCRVVHIGEDPVFVRYPMRSFPSDLAVQAGVTNALTALSGAVEQRLQMAEARIAARRGRLAERMRNRRAQLAKDAAPGQTISPEYLSRCIGDCVGEDAVIFNEYPLRADHCPREKPGTLYALGPAGGLGWGFGAALGAKLASPDKMIVATLGDGAYMFGNPMVGHWVAGKYNLPILAIVFNNSRYGAVRKATLSMFKEGVAGESDGRVLADLDPAPAYEELAKAQGAHAERVEKPADLPEALARARNAVLIDKRQALLNVITPY